MANLAGVTDNFFTVASETFTDNLSGSILAGATVVPVNNASEYTNGDCVVLTVDPGTVNEATFIGKKNGSQFEECVWTEGNIAVGHSAGATIIDYDSATHHSAQSKGIQQFANDDGTLKTQPVRDALGLGATAVNGWEVFPHTVQVSTGYNIGNGQYNLTVANQDVRTTISKGMKFRLDRSITAPTQCMDNEASSSQYASRASGSITGALGTVTDDITIEANINVESFNGGVLISKNSVIAQNGFRVYLDSIGRIIIDAAASAGNTKSWTTRVGVQLSKWFHIAASMDLSSSSTAVYINGISVTVDISTAGTCNAFTNAGNFHIGTQVGPVNFFDGKVTDVRIWNTLRTATQIKDNMHQQLVGSETNLIGYWKLNGDFNDSTSNNNHLTASGGVVATNLDNPFSNTQYVLIGDVTYSAPNSTLVVYAAENNVIPNMTLSSPYYSVQDSPYNYPSLRSGILNRKNAGNPVSIVPTNTSQDLAVNGLITMITVPNECMVQATVAIGLTSTTDFEFRPEIRLDGTVQKTYSPSAALGNASSRAFSRTFTYAIKVPAGTHTVSAGVFLAAATSPLIAVDGAQLAIEAPGDGVW